MFLYEGLQEEEPVMGADVLCQCHVECRCLWDIWVVELPVDN